MVEMGPVLSQKPVTPSQRQQQQDDVAAAAVASPASPAAADIADSARGDVRVPLTGNTTLEALDVEATAAFLILNLYFADLGVDKSVDEIYDAIYSARRRTVDWAHRLDQTWQREHGVAPGLATGLQDQMKRLKNQLRM